MRLEEKAFKKGNAANREGTLYRVDKGGNGYEVKETRKTKEDLVETAEKKDKASGPSRQELMEAVKAKKITNFRIMNKTELAEIVKPGTTNIRIKEIQETAVKRWKSGWKFQAKEKDNQK